MISKYIKMDPIPWLTDGENPAVEYHVENEILRKSDHEEIYKKLLNSDLTGYFKKNYAQGVLGDFKHPDLFYRGSVWFFLLAVESGYKNDVEFINTTAEMLCKKIQLDNGGFKFNYNSSEAVGCRSGNLTNALIKSGAAASSALNGINWILKNQRKDGGWLHCPVAGFCDVMKLLFLNKPGNSLKYESDSEITSCPVASYSCLKALVEFNNEKHNDIIKKGADFFISNNYFIRSKKKLFCGNRVDFARYGYPVMSQYDYLSGLIIVSSIKTSGNSINGELFNSIIKKQNQDGSWNCENRLQGMINQKSEKSRWTTLNAIRFINLVVEKESQLEKA